MTFFFWLRGYLLVVKRNFFVYLKPYISGIKTKNTNIRQVYLNFLNRLMKLMLLYDDAGGLLAAGGLKLNQAPGFNRRLENKPPTIPPHTPEQQRKQKKLDAKYSASYSYTINSIKAYRSVKPRRFVSMGSFPRQSGQKKISPFPSCPFSHISFSLLFILFLLNTNLLTQRISLICIFYV